MTEIADRGYLRIRTSISLIRNKIACSVSDLYPLIHPIPSVHIVCLYPLINAVSYAHYPLLPLIFHQMPTLTSCNPPPNAHSYLMQSSTKCPLLPYAILHQMPTLTSCNPSPIAHFYLHAILHQMTLDMYSYQMLLNFYLHQIPTYPVSSTLAQHSAYLHHPPNANLGVHILIKCKRACTLSEHAVSL